MAPAELTQSQVHLHTVTQKSRKLAQRHRLRAVNAPVPGLPGCQALWFAAPHQFVPEDSVFQWRGEEETMFGRIDDEMMVTA